MKNNMEKCRFSDLPSPYICFNFYHHQRSKKHDLRKNGGERLPETTILAPQYSKKSICDEHEFITPHHDDLCLPLRYLQTLEKCIQNLTNIEKKQQCTKTAL
uniref:Uncharacterized protein n=1 Tax=Romanomermis culicivorax TaxID=13658 RepID=A0A915KQP5_ROMCU